MKCVSNIYIKFFLQTWIENVYEIKVTTIVTIHQTTYKTDMIIIIVPYKRFCTKEYNYYHYVLLMSLYYAKCQYLGL